MLRIIYFSQNYRHVYFYIADNPVCDCFSLFLSTQPMTDIQIAIKDRDGQLSEFLLSYEKLRMMYHAFFFCLDPL